VVKEGFETCGDGDGRQRKPPPQAAWAVGNCCPLFKLQKVMLEKHVLDILATDKIVNSKNYFN
jgi:hypothetical protein